MEEEGDEMEKEMREKASAKGGKILRELWGILYVYIIMKESDM